MGRSRISALPDNPQDFFRGEERAGQRTVRFYGICRGRVENADDPEQRGRLQVRVLAPLIHPEPRNVAGGIDPNCGIFTEDLPWAEPCMADGSRWSGDFNVPYHVGDMVWIMFEGGDEDYPVWLGGTYAAPESNREDAQNYGVYQQNVPPEAIRVDSQHKEYPYRRVFKTRRGHTIEMADTVDNEEIRITTIAGNTIWLDDAAGKMVIEFNGELIEHVQGDVSRHVGGSVTEYVEGNFYRCIRGKKAEDIGGDFRQFVTGSVKRRIGADHTYQVGGRERGRINGDLQVRINGTWSQRANAGIVPKTISAEGMAPTQVLDPGSTVTVDPMDNAPVSDWPDPSTANRVPNTGRIIDDRQQQDRIAVSRNMKHNLGDSEITARFNERMPKPAFPYGVRRVPRSQNGYPRNDGVVRRGG